MGVCRNLAPANSPNQTTLTIIPLGFQVKLVSHGANFSDFRRKLGRCRDGGGWGGGVRGGHAGQSADQVLLQLALSRGGGDGGPAAAAAGCPARLQPQGEGAGLRYLSGRANLRWLRGKNKFLVKDAKTV